MVTLAVIGVLTSYTYKVYDMRVKSASNKRIIAEAKVNGKTAYFLLDTGASVGVMDYGKVKEYDLVIGKRYYGEIIGSGGKLTNVRYCHSIAEILERKIPQFLLADISEIVSSIKRETGIEILGIISLPQMKMANLSIDCNDNEIIIEQ